MGRLNARDVEALHADLQPVARSTVISRSFKDERLDEIAAKHGVTRSTIDKHIRLLPVPLPGLLEWSQKIAEYQ